jgi:hypothetical protein
LYHERPSSQAESGFVDRELEIAISQFAPGAQTVKDDLLLTAVGIMDPVPVGRNIVYQPNPLGQSVRVGLCRQCQALVENPQRKAVVPTALLREGMMDIELLR